MPTSRARLFALSAVLTAVLAACGGATPTSTLVGTVAVRVATTTTTVGAATTTSAPTATTTAPTAAAATTAPPDTAATTTAATIPAGTTAAPAAPTSTAPGASTAPLDATRVGALYTRFGYAVTADEAACLAREITPEALATLEQGGDAALVGAVTSAFVMALARCEPLTFLQEQDAITMDDYGVTAEQARCVTKALDVAARDDAAVALAYYEGTATLPPEGQQRLVDALTPCVGVDKAREIITT